MGYGKRFSYEYTIFETVAQVSSVFALVGSCGSYTASRRIEENAYLLAGGVMARMGEVSDALREVPSPLDTASGYSPVSTPYTVTLSLSRTHPLMERVTTTVSFVKAMKYMSVHAVLQ
ncbi:hypothetical protein BDV98DRAFT_572331 [Pterulicium gracile]|uniref:Uncharacterized protein n=1 Tax=Pterulicium gracile TaxID=1884261 RepID=A0A5C3QCR5_9AGAR|nr:hypothetical protein BDV98DRAFT_572331 [Pterula gracilis]